MGPLILSVACARKAASWLWALLGVAGVLLLGGSELRALDPAGVAFAATAGVLWACYILLSARAAVAFAKLDGLAIAMAVAAAATLPFGVASSGTALLRPDVILLGLAVAVLSSTAPYALEMSALRRLPASAFAVLMALAPAMAALVGALVLGQHLSALSWLAVGLVVAASIGAVLFAGERRGNRRTSDGGVNAVPSPRDAGTHVGT
jgi:inner membrane transporter RhtA